MMIDSPEQGEVLVYYGAQRNSAGPTFSMGPVPVICLGCRKQVPGFFAFRSGRYGQVATFPCGSCGGRIVLNDNDNPPYQLRYSYIPPGETMPDYHDQWNTSGEVLAFRPDVAYFVGKLHFDAIRIHTGFDVLAAAAESKRGTFSLSRAVRICQSEFPYVHEFRHGGSMVREYPAVVSAWRDIVCSVMERHCASFRLGTPPA